MKFFKGACHTDRSNSVSWGFLGAQNSGLSHLPQDSSELFVVCTVKRQHLKATFLARAKRSQKISMPVFFL